MRSKEVAKLYLELDKATKATQIHADPTSTSSPDPALNPASLARDCATVLHSHCTKLSLAARPPRTEAAVTACLNYITQVLPLLAVLCQTLQPHEHGIAICDTVRNQVKYALSGLSLLVEAIEEVPVSEDRLSRTAILWESCVELQKIPTLPVLVSRKLKESLHMVTDAIEDLESWASGESDGNFDDFDDSGSDSDSDSLDSTTMQKSKDSEAESERRISMLKRIQLLLKAIDKRRITPDATVSQLNDIHTNITKLTIEIDDWACEIQESADAAYVLEMEKNVVLRVEELLSATTAEGTDGKWQEWTRNFKMRWLEEVKNAKADHEP